MSNTYSQVHIHTVFAVKHRACVISPSWKDELYKYITGIVQERNHKLVAINGMPDHIHIVIGLRPNQSISDLIQQVKAISSKWINEHKALRNRFEWQSGYGVFSYRKKDLDNLIAYVMNQEFHHGAISFYEEYKTLLEDFEIDYDERYLFKDLE